MDETVKAGEFVSFDDMKTCEKQLSRRHTRKLMKVEDVKQEEEKKTEK
jgi:hypothetical protein